MFDPQQRLRRMERVLTINLELTSNSSLQSVLQSIVQAAAELTDSESAGILLSNEPASVLRFVAATGARDQIFDMPVPIDASIAGASFSSGQPVIVPDVSVDPRYYPKVAETIGVPARSLLAVPLQFRNRKIGVLEVENKKGDQVYDTADAQVLTALAVQATIAIENARLIAEYQHLLQAEQTQRQMSDGLRHASIALGSTLDYAQVIDRILEQIMLVVANDASNVMIIEEGDTGRVFRGRGYAQFGTADTLTATTLNVQEVSGFREMRATGKPMVVPDVTLDPDWVYSRPEHTWIKSYIGAPIIIRGEVIGFLNAMSTTPGFYTPSDAERLQDFAYHAANAIDNARLYRQAQVELAERIKIAEELRQHRDLLEARVAERTADLAAANARLSREIVEREQAQGRVTEQQRALATLEERERMVRELHDGLGQVMSYINVQAQAAQTLLSKGETLAAQANLEHMSQVAQQAHSDIRGYILGLRTGARFEQNLFDAVPEFLRQFSESTSIATRLSLPDPVPSPAFAPAVEEQVLRILQEALTNVRKHASAHQVEVLFSFTDDQAQVIIADDGRGFDPATMTPSGHFGLSIMRERANQVGGQIEFRSAVGQGTQVVLHVPRFVPSDAPDLSSVQGIRVLIADDHPLFADGLRNLLTARGLTVLDVAHDGLEAQEMARALHPDLIVMDLVMPRCNGLEATRVIKAELPEIKIVMLTLSEDDQDVFEAIKSGASGYLVKSLDANEFCSLLVSVMNGQAPLAPGLAARILGEFARRDSSQAGAGTGTTQPPAELTPRQWEILQMVARGLTYKEISASLHLAEQTVKYHMSQILERLQLETREQAIAYAKRMQSK